MTNATNGKILNQCIVEFIVNIKYHFQYNCKERFLVEDENFERYYLGEEGSDGHELWKRVQKGDKMYIIYNERSKPVHIELISGG